MILILSDEQEPTTEMIIDWLIYFEKDFVRISQNDVLHVKKIYQTGEGFEAIFSYEKFNIYREIDTQNITSYWYRRSQLELNFTDLDIDNKDVKKILLEYNYSEYKSLVRILYDILNRKKHINRYDDNFISKIGLLESAKTVGLKTPETLICSDKNDLVNFYNRFQGNIITKPIGDPTSIFYAGFHCYTTKVNIDDIPDTFAPTLFQEMLHKKIELRIFYFNEMFYGSAIFSQADSQTQLDFKNYNHKKPNRVVPYKITGTLKGNLKKLMELNNLNSGSIDVVLTDDYEYVFLEVNPVGQFEQVSLPCNYNLFKKIAEYL